MIYVCIVCMIMCAYQLINGAEASHMEIVLVWQIIDLQEGGKQIAWYHRAFDQSTWGIS